LAVDRPQLRLAAHDERTPVRRTPALAVTVMTLWALTACTASDPTPAPDEQTASTGPEAGTTGADTPGAGTPAPDAPFAGSTEECLLGTWQLDLTAMQDGLRAMFVGAEGQVEVAVGGTTTYEFAAGGTFGADVDSSSSMTMRSDGAELTSTSTSTGSLAGAWTLAGDQLTISDVDTRDLDVTTTAALDDDPVDVPAGSAQDAIEALPPTVSTMTCRTGTLTLVSSLATDEDSDPVTITHTLRR